MTRWKVNAISIVLMITVLIGCGIRTADDNYTEQETSDASTESSTKPSTEPSTEPSIESSTESSIVQTVDGKVVLTERQKAILEKEGLPTDYNELKGLQQDAITKIEKCFQYLERTYPDDNFTYYYYEGIDIGRDGGDKLHVLSEKIGSGRVVTVTIRYSEGDKQDVFRDDYMMVMESDVYEEEISKQVRSLAPDAEFFVDASIDEYVDGDSYIMERASGYSAIVMNDAFESEDEVKAFLEAIAEWLNNNNTTMAKGVTCLVFYPDDYKDVTLNNYKDLSKKRKIKFDVTCSINRNQKIHIY